MKYKYLRPEDPSSLDDFESKITEIAMKLDRDFGSFENALGIGRILFNKAKPHLSADETAQFIKLIGHVKHLADLALEREAEYLDLQAELNSYLSGNFIFDAENRQLVYLDHKDFNTKYPKFNGILPK